MPYQVALLNFEGPLDLLLQLIERADLEITQISLGEVTAQYLDYLSQLPSLSPQELNQFLNLAARLIYLKSLALLPTADDQDFAAELTDLTAELEQYRHYQTASRYLEGLLRTKRQSWTRQTTPTLPAAKRPLPKVTLANLEQALREAIAQLPPKLTTEPITPAISLEDMTKQFLAWLKQQPGPVELTQFLITLPGRSELIVGFVSVLELQRQSTIELIQDQVFGAIMVMSSH